MIGGWYYQNAPLSNTKWQNGNKQQILKMIQNDSKSYYVFVSYFPFDCFMQDETSNTVPNTSNNFSLVMDCSKFLCTRISCSYYL